MASIPIEQPKRLGAIQGKRHRIDAEIAPNEVVANACQVRLSARRPGAYRSRAGRWPRRSCDRRRRMTTAVPKADGPLQMPSIAAARCLRKRYAIPLNGQVEILIAHPEQRIPHETP